MGECSEWFRGWEADLYARFGGGGGALVLVSTTSYYYNDAGNPSHIVTEYEDPDPGQKKFHRNRFGYAKNGRAVVFVLGEEWNSGFSNYAITFAREFRYDGARQRYMNRALVPGDLMEDPPVFTTLSETWTDYDGDEPYGDFTVTPGNPPTVTDLRSFELGIGVVDPWTNNGEDDTKYFHTDHLGTTRFMSADAGATSGVATYTAFGERVSGSDHRYGYAGAWGYQGTLDDQTPPAAVFPFLHLGNRYYDPSSGRFLQCDPIDIRGGPNVYN